MDLQLKGKRAFVSGSSSGIGAAIALELAAEGVDVVVHGRDHDRAGEIAQQVAAKGVRAAIATGDLSSDDDADRIAETALAEFSGIDILVNNAGAVLRMDNPDPLDLRPDEWLAAYSVNLVAGIRLLQRFLPGMKERSWGRIINISSTGGSQTTGFHIDYGAAKAAVDNATVNLSKRLAPEGITVNAVIPGTILTPAVERWLETLKGQLGWGDDFAENERVYTTELLPQPVPRLGRPREIAVAVAMLASPLSGYTTGASLRVDGGTANHIGS